MTTAGRKLWALVAIIVGVGYFLVAILSTTLSNSAASNQLRVGWRLAAWVVSAAVYAAHLAYEHYRLNNSYLVIALHVTMAVAIGAFLLAVSASVHALTVTSHAPWWQYGLALVVWPVATALPAFLFGLTISWVLLLLRRRR
jgi:hypothetical protein